MAKPRYIICSQERIIDQASGLASHINVLDRFVVHSFKTPETAQADKVFLVPQIPVAQFVVTAAWAKGEDDSKDDEFDFEVILRKPEGEEKTIQSGTFRFAKRFFRIDAGVMITTRSTFTQSGEMVLECKIRKQGTVPWLSQSFPIDIEVVPVETAHIEEDAGEHANQ